MYSHTKAVVASEKKRGKKMKSLLESEAGRQKLATADQQLAGLVVVVEEEEEEEGG